MSSQEHIQLKGRLFTLPFLFFLGLSIYAGVITVERFVYGLEAVTNLNDGYPWGIWVVFDVMIGSAFGCAGYVMALVVYIMNRGEYHPLVRPALMASLFGYGLAGLAVMIDLGRYWNFYHMFMPDYINVNSVMLEVGLCVAAYTTVLLIEFMPAVLERFGIENLRVKLNKILFLFIALGVLLPTMHQSSLGTMLVVLGHQVSDLWQTQMLPILFLMSAMLMGFATVIGESVLASWGYRRPFETALLGRMTGIMAWFIIAYLAIRVVDMTIRGAWDVAFAGDMDAVMFWAENLFFGLALMLVLPKQNRLNLRALFLASVFLILAGSLVRINAYLIGYHPAGGSWEYFPSFKEIMLTVGMFSFEVVLYMVFVKLFPILPNTHALEHEPKTLDEDTVAAE